MLPMPRISESRPIPDSTLSPKVCLIIRPTLLTHVHLEPQAQRCVPPSTSLASSLSSSASSSPSTSSASSSPSTSPSVPPPGCPTSDFSSPPSLSAPKPFSSGSPPCLLPLPRQSRKGALEASAEPAKPVRAPKGGRRKKYLSLPDELAHCINSFEQCPFLAEQVLQRKHARYAKQMPAQKAMSNKLGYPAHFEKAREGIEVNARFSDQMAQIAREDYHTGPRALEDEEDAEFGVVDLVFGHLSRDWSTQGAKERQAVFPPVLDGLEQHFGGNGKGKRVFVPGSGMGRLASDIADLGYDVTANELDYGSIPAYHLLTNHTSSLHQHTLQPFVTKWTHQANPSSRYSALTVPDHWPNKAVKLVEGDFLDMFPRDGELDAVVTLFFIDISKNVVDFLSNIHRLLKPGGVWINLGPLKWGTHSALQLSAEEVLRLADLLGFDVGHTSRKSIDSLYAEQPDTLLKFTYVTQFWSVTKRV